MSIDMEYVVKEWDRKILSTIVHSGVRYDDALDLKSKIYLDMISRRICDKYDPNKSQFSTYLYTYLHSVISNYRRDSNAKKRFLEKSCLSLSEVRVYYEENRESVFGDSPLNSVQEEFIIDQIVRDFNRFRCPKVFKGKTDFYIKRILTMCVEGYTLSEVASALGVKKHEIQRVLKSIRQLRWLKELSR